MRKPLLLLTIALLLPLFADAQTTSVTLQVTDASAQSWNNGSWSVLLVSQQGATNFGPPFNLVAGGSVPNQAQSGALSGTGVASITLTPNASVLPSQSQWRFTVCPQQGIPAQCFIQPILIFGSSQTVTLTPPTISVNCGPGINAYADSEVGCQLGGQYYNVTTPSQRQCTASTGTVCTTWAAAGGGITSVSSLPGTCTPGVTANVNLTIAGFGYGEFYCSGLPGSNTWTPVNPQQTISPIAYGAHKKYFVTDCTFTASAVVNCTGGDVHFLAQAAVGDIAFGTSGLTSVSSTAAGVLACPDTTILTINSDTQVTLNAACTVPCTPAAGVTCNFAWGTGDDTIPLENAKAAAWNNADSCYALQLPSWPLFVNSQFLNGPVGNKCGGGTGGNATYFDLNSQGPAVFGQGGQASKIIPRPTFDFSSCTKGISGAGCALTATNINAQNFGIDGLQQSLPTTTHAVNLVELNGLTGFCSGGVTFNNMGLAGWATQSASSIGLAFGSGMCNDSVLYNVNMQQFGASTVKFNGSGGAVNTVSVVGLMAYGATGNNLTLNGNAGTVLNSSNSNYFTNFTSNQGIIQCGGGNAVFNSTDDSFAPTSNTGAIQQIFFCNGGSMTINLDKAYVATTNGAATSNLFFLNGTSVIHIRNSRLDFSGGTTRLATMGAGDIIYNDGGNKFIPGSTASVITNYVPNPGNNVKGICTGLATASTTIGLYGTGPNATTLTCTSATIGSGVPVTGSRTLQNLLCTIGVAATTNTTCTALVNGGASIVTCTIAPAALTCNDFVHTVAVTDGQLVSLEAIIGAATTPTGIQMQVEWNN